MEKKYTKSLQREYIGGCQPPVLYCPCNLLMLPQTLRAAGKGATVPTAEFVVFKGTNEQRHPQGLCNSNTFVSPDNVHFRVYCNNYDGNSPQWQEH
jgi:hypothetical protein